MNFFKRTMPTWFVLVMGIAMIIQYYIPNHYSNNVLDESSRWYRLITAFALVIGVTNLLRTHYMKIRRSPAGWGYSGVLYLSFIVMAFCGFYFGIGRTSPFMWLFSNVQVPLTATTFSLTGFFICSAAFRAFRAKNYDALIMMVTAIIVMIGRIPFGELLSQHFYHWIPGLDKITSWIMDYPMMSARRAISLGISLGGIATSLRIILGIERSYQGRD